MTDSDDLDAATIAAWRNEGRTRQEIADHFNVSLARVKRMISSHHIVGRKRAASDRPKTTITPRERRVFVPLEDGMSLMEKCKVVLGSRMSQDHRGYLLDGRPSNTGPIVKAARAAGLEA